ncbi:MAG TPA: LysR family transcriptional regulator [Burkholderiales bacterium]|nr:LysR family transcriptional regulator [Burkholderiales bacterium]
MDRLQEMSVFVAVADEQSFAAAARKLRMSPPAVTRSVSALETRLATRLFTRTTRSVRVTDAGIRFLYDCRRILSEVDEAEAAAAGSHAIPRGELSVTASVPFGELFVMPVLIEFLERYRDVTARTVFTDRVVNMIEEGVDLAVRIAELPDSSLTAVRVGQVRNVVCGAPAYFAKVGVPKHPKQLEDHRIAAIMGVSATNEWVFYASGKPLTVRVRPQIVANTKEAAIAAATQGWALTRTISYSIAAQLEAGSLKTVLPQYEPPALPIHVIRQEGRHASAKVRAFMELLVERLRENPRIH